MNIFKRDYSNYNEQVFIEEITNNTWFTGELDTNEQFDNFITGIENCLEKHAPLTKLNKIQSQKITKPWISKTILKLISYRERLFKQKKYNPNHQTNRAYSLFRIIISVKCLANQILRNKSRGKALFSDSARV